MNLIFVIGLPRSGTSLVHNLLVKETGRKAPRYKDFGIDTRRLPEAFKELNPTFRDNESLAEDNDFPGTLAEYRSWLEIRGDSWVLKSPDHVAHLAELMEVFPEAHFLWCLREASETLASIREYWQLLGVGPEYDLRSACNSGLLQVRTHPERFDWINVHTIPEFESSRTGIPSPESIIINDIYSKVKGACNCVDSRNFKERYSP